MQPMQQTDGSVVRRYDYDDRTVVVADFGPGVDPDVDVVGSTAIVVLGDDDQHEIDLPTGDVEAVNRNGVVTFEVRE